ncbi:hypothetical protein IAR55_005965 [Kwoniella newhampshirensis]|uniref:Palmitoyltransferase n=1 Tax=Kwoniella newhampshirensis TaxID=1651941 RepID=A0AAW0YGQ2_9TREE
MTPDHTRVEDGPVKKGNRSTSLDKSLSRLPLYFSYALLGSTWFLFTLFISVGEILIRRREIGRFAEQVVIYHVLLLMTVLSLITTSNRPPDKPDQIFAPVSRLPLTTIRPVNMSDSEAKPIEQSGREVENDDDVPLRYLKNAQWVTSRITKDRPSPLPLSTNRRYLPPLFSGTTSRPSLSSQDSESDYSPFPLSASQFIFTSTKGTGVNDYDIEQDRAMNDVAEVEDGGRERSALLTPAIQDDPFRPESGGSIMAKSNTGGARWCKKCAGWKPDRCHHCRHCRQCVLKMDHHCPWVGTCVGYHNYKPFLLFVSYATLLALYVTIEAGYECFRLFQDPDVTLSQPPPPQLSLGEAESRKTTDTWANELGLTPAVFMMLAVLGVFMMLAVGSLAGFHWYLACNNQTTLENITHSYPSVLLDIVPDDSHQWKPDHLLTRREKQKLRYEAREINVYDMGWRKNLSVLFLGQSAASKQGWWGKIARAMWPVNRKDDQGFGGHYFEYDEEKLERLKLLTMELRHGLVMKGESEDRHDGDEGIEGDITYEDEVEQEKTKDGSGYDEEGKEIEEVAGRKRLDWFEVV